MKNDSCIRAGEAALVAATLSFIGVFSYLAAKFNYPDVLDAPAATALPALLSKDTAGRAVWSVYGSLLPVPVRATEY